ncbi:hypothetical protein [Coleofasciculus sp. E2-BRE-01]|uniref:hypothetical protein n=1 Tax=Coleofasciculus sp. E2-BRE-01 TaxID=3069524 RepID=UPI0032FF40A3
MSVLVKNNPETQKILSKIIAQTWVNEEFKSQFISHTNPVLEENGLTIPSGVEFQVINNTLVGTMTNKVPGQDGNVVCEIPLPSKPMGLTDQPIQSWIGKNNFDYLAPDCEERICEELCT